MLRFTTLMNGLRRHLPGYAILFLLLGGGTAYAIGPVFSSDIVDGQVKSVDIADNGVTGVDIANNGLTGVDINEDTLQFPCQPGAIHGFARVKGSDGMGEGWREDRDVIDTVYNCRGGAVRVRKMSTGVYHVRFEGGNPSRIAVASVNTDGAPTTDSRDVDNIVSVARLEPGLFRVETVDVNDAHSGDTDPQDTWFTLMLL